MSGLDLKFNEVLYFPGNTLPSSPSVIVPTGLRVSCCWVGFFFFLSGFDICSVALLARVLWASQKISTRLCSQSKRGLSWSDCKSQLPAWAQPAPGSHLTPHRDLHLPTDCTRAVALISSRVHSCPCLLQARMATRTARCFAFALQNLRHHFWELKSPMEAGIPSLPRHIKAFHETYIYVYVCVCVQNNTENNTEIKSAIFLHHIQQVSLLHCQVNSYHLANDSIYSKLPNTTLLAEKTRPQRSIIWPKASTSFPSFRHGSFGSRLLLPFFPKDPSNIGRHHNEYCLLSLPIW